MMFYAIQWIRSLIFNAQMYLAMAIIALAYAPFAVFSRDWAYGAVHAYCRWVRWSAGWMIGLKSEIRGEPPSDEVLIAAKHQSFFDVIMIVSVMPRPRFIMKAILKWAPILGWYGMRIGCIPVHRGRRGAAILKMKKDVEAGRSDPGQLIIYPQGTRVAPGVKKPYKIGTAVLYEELGTDCVPAATNVGVFWPKRGVYRKPGLAVVEFLPRIPAGLQNKEFIKKLESQVETRSDELMAQAGFSFQDASQPP